MLIGNLTGSIAAPFLLSLLQGVLLISLGLMRKKSRLPFIRVRV